jgi:hypothetical protein
MSLSPDRQRVLAVPIRTLDHIDVLPTGAGETRSIKDEGMVDYQWVGWLPDGHRIVFNARARGAAAPRMYVRELAGGPARPVTPEGITVVRDTVTVDDGALAAPCAPPNAKQACLYPLDGAGEPRPIPGTEGRSVLSWGDKGALYLREGRSFPARIFRLDTATGHAESWRELAPLDRAGVVGVGNIALTPDGRSYAYNYARQLSDLYVASGVE